MSEASPLPFEIKALTGEVHHPSYGGWAKFLETCELRDFHDGIAFYGKVNCNYILFPCGALLQNYGFNGEALMSRIREEGASVILEEVKECSRKLKNILEGVAHD